MRTPSSDRMGAPANDRYGVDELPRWDIYTWYVVRRVDGRFVFAPATMEVPPDRRPAFRNEYRSVEEAVAAARATGLPEAKLREWVLCRERSEVLPHPLVARRPEAEPAE